jgi:hypothetical protein
MGLLISKGGKAKKAPYQQSSVRCPDPATPQARAILNMYRELYQNKSEQQANDFLNQVEMFAMNLYAGDLHNTSGNEVDNSNTSGNEGENTATQAIREIAEKIKNNESGFKKNSATALCKAILEVSESIG